MTEDAENEAIKSLGALLAAHRWAKATPAQRKAQGKAMAKGRKKAKKAKVRR